MEEITSTSEDQNRSVMVDMLIQEEVAEKEEKRRRKFLWKWTSGPVFLVQAIYFYSKPDVPAWGRYAWYALTAYTLFMTPIWAYRHYIDFKKRQAEAERPQ